MSRRQRVSLCMIVRDEEHNLEACLKPVAELFDEIVIVDTGSRDRTVEIARRYTPNVHYFEWCDDFSAARNESLRHATGEWVFWLDADDRVRPPQVAMLRRLFEQLEDRRQGYLLNTVIRSSQPGEDASLITHLRLFRRQEKLRWRGRVHEQIELNYAPAGCELLSADVEIEHVGYQDAGLAARKARRHLRLLRMDYAVDPNCPKTLLHLALAMGNSNREAKQHLLRLLEMDLGAAECLRWVFDALVNLAHLAGDRAEAASYVSQGLARFPDDEYLLLAQARMHHVSRNYASAACVLERIMRNPPSRYQFFGQVGHVREKVAPRMLGAACRAQRHYAKAEGLLRQVVSQFPDDVESWFNLGLVYVDQARGGELSKVVDRLLDTPGGETNARLLNAQWQLRYGDLELAGRMIDQLITSHPTHSRQRMLRAEWLARSHNSSEIQRRALHDVLRIEPGNLEAQYWLQKTSRAKLPAAASGPMALATTSFVVMPGAPVA